MARRGIPVLARIAVALSVLVMLAALPDSTLAASPTLKASAAVSGFTAKVSYRVTVGRRSIARQTCTLTRPTGVVTSRCDSTRNTGSTSTLTKYAVTYQTPTAGTYTFRVRMRLTNGTTLRASTKFVVVPGPAVRFSVTGLVEQPTICTVGTGDCGAPSYPRQIAKITARDVNGNVATGYTGTVTFNAPNSTYNPLGLAPQTLNRGIGYVPVLVPNMLRGAPDEPEASACPVFGDGSDPNRDWGIVLTVQDAVNPSIFGCQRIHGGSIQLVVPEGYFNLYVAPPGSPDPCSSGCYEDPTGTITIDTNTLATMNLSQEIQSGGSVDIGGGAANGNYFTEAISIGTLAITGQSLGVDALAPCAQCSTGTNYLAPGSTQPQVGSTIVDMSQSISLNVLTPVLPWSTTPVAATATAPVTGGFKPQCWDNYSMDYFTVILTTDLCKAP